MQKDASLGLFNLIVPDPGGVASNAETQVAALTCPQKPGPIILLASKLALSLFFCDRTRCAALRAASQILPRLSATPTGQREHCLALNRAHWRAATPHLLTSLHEYSPVGESAQASLSPSSPASEQLTEDQGSVSSNRDRVFPYDSEFKYPASRDNNSHQVNKIIDREA